MPYRNIPLVTGETYHVFNRSVAKQPIFLNLRDYQRFIETINFYRFAKLQLRFSHYDRLQIIQRNTYLKTLETTSESVVSIIAFCLMPNHFHFLLRQEKDQGIPSFMKNIQNSYAKYFNTKNNRSGALFQGMFKSVRIESDEQLFHVSRYIHLNPITSYIISDAANLEAYPWSSFGVYMGKLNYPFINTEVLTSNYKNVESLKEFTLDQIDYQRKLAEEKHLLLDNP